MAAGMAAVKGLLTKPAMAAGSFSRNFHGGCKGITNKTGHGGWLIFKKVINSLFFNVFQKVSRHGQFC